MQHPDEGTIHAWLDGALGAEEARALEAHVAGCPRCAATVTEARGLLAASSRILAALDAVPGGVLPATAPEAGDDPRVVSIVRPPRWRSPAWRAAAAIVLVGSVSWLATRTVPRAEDRISASRSGISTVGTADSIVAQAPPAIVDTLAQVAPQVAPQAGKPAREAASAGAAAGHLEPSRKVAAREAAPPQLAAAPRAIPYAMPRLVEPPNAGAIGGGAAGEAKVAAPIVPPPAAPASANAALREESRAADAGISARNQVTAQARMKSSAPGAAIGMSSRMQASPPTDPDVERLAGCYYVEKAASHSERPEIRSAAEMVPAQFELSPDRDPSAGGSWRILRPAPGAPPFRLAARAAWLLLTADSVKLELSEGMESVSVRFGVKGDSVHGYATVTDPRLPGGGIGTGVRGSRMLCSSP